MSIITALSGGMTAKAIKTTSLSRSHRFAYGHHAGWIESEV